MKRLKAICKNRWTILAAVFLITNLVILFSDIGSSLVYLQLEQVDAEDNAEICMTITADGGTEYTETSVVSDGIVEFFIPREYYDIEQISLSSVSEVDYADAVIVFVSRTQTLYRGTLELASGDVISESQIQTISKYINNDWFVKLQMVVAAWVFFFVLGFLLFLKNTKLDRVRLVVTVLATVLLIFCAQKIMSLEDTYMEEDPDVTNNTVTEVITSEVAILQEVNTDNEILGLELRLATNKTTLNTNYALVWFDAEGNLLEQVEIEASEIEDNSYLSVTFSETYSAGNYYFSIKSMEETTDTLFIWMSKTDDYESGSLSINGVKETGDLDFKLLVAGPNLKVWTSAIVGILYLLVLMVTWKIKFSVQLVYAASAALALAMIIFAWKYLYLGNYDESAQISYIVNMASNWEFVPSFDTQYLVVKYGSTLSSTSVNVYYSSQVYGIAELQLGDTVNYLGHPPLYYWIMAALPTVTISGDLIRVNLDVLRLANVMISMGAILLYLYIGYSRIDKKKPELHFLYASVVASMPMITGTAASINNDNLAFLVAAVFTLSMMRFTEGKRDFFTYFLINFSIACAALTKLTVLLVIVITALMVAFGTVYREKSWGCLLDKKFLVTLLLYIVPFLYYILLYKEYGTFMIGISKLVSSERLKQYTFLYVEESARSTRSYLKFIQNFFKNFLAQWYNGSSWNIGTISAIYRRLGHFVYQVMWLGPLAAIFAAKLKDEKAWFYKSFSVGLLLAVLLQFMRAFSNLFYKLGHAGQQSRYYVCVAPLMIFLICEGICRLMDKRVCIALPKQKKMIRLEEGIRALAILGGILAVYGGVLMYMFYCVDFCR